MLDPRPATTTAAGRRFGRRVVLAGVLLGVLSGPQTAPAAGRPAGQPAVEPSSVTAPGTRPGRTVELERAHVARPGPGAGTGRGVRVAARRPITRARTILPVLAEARDVRGHLWLRVLLPGRPNGATGWIAAEGTASGTTPWAVTVDVSRRRLVVFRNGRTVRRFAVVVGAPGTPTPRGRFFVEETVRLTAGRVGGPYALALSARSEVLQEFAGGPGQIALHGRDGIGGALGAALSHGCVRLGDDAVRWLARRIGPGVRVTVRR